jgi:hypothetical protein
MSLFHYSNAVKVVTLTSREEAEERLQNGRKKTKKVYQWLNHPASYSPVRI